jgi:DNA-binding response OmpR family regulator
MGKSGRVPFGAPAPASKRFILVQEGRAAGFAGHFRYHPGNDLMSQRKILIVDDEVDILHFLELVLQERGYQVTSATGGQNALALARAQRPDLVLLDIMMPQMDGWEVLRLLRVDPKTQTIPVAMISARTDAKDRVQGLQEGALDYICKPFSLDELLTKVDSLFAQIDAGREA